MVNLRDDLRIAVDALRAHKLRAVLTVLGLTMGVATLMTVMTLVQGANLYVEQKIANLGTNVFRVAKTPFAVVDFTVVVKALKNKNIDISDYRAVAELCRACEEVGASANGTLSVQYQNKQTDDTTIIGYTPNMVDIDTRTLDLGRYFTARRRSARGLCLHHRRLPGRPVLSRTTIPSAATSAPAAWNSRSSERFRSSVRCWARIRIISSSSRSTPT